MVVSPTLNIIARKNYLLLKDKLFKQNNKPRVLCIGASEVAGEGISVFGDNIINIDIKYGKNIDVVCNAETLPFKNYSFDLIILQAVLEHICDYKQAIKETRRVLKDNAYIYVEMPFLQGRHGYSDYRRFTLDGLRLEMNEFKEIVSGQCCGPFSSFVWITFMIFALFFSFNNKWLFNKLKIFFLFIFSPLKYLDVFFLKSKDAESIASTFYFMGKKS